MARIMHLETARVLRIAGKDALSFLQGIITADTAPLSRGEPVFSALLSPQGKFLYDFFLIAEDAESPSLLLTTEARQLPQLTARLRMYTLRADVTLTPCEDWYVYAVAEPAYPRPEGTLAYPDPRHAELGQRWLTPTPLPDAWVDGDEATYHAWRLRLGVPEGWHDAIFERSFLLELGYDAVGAVDFAKGCYVGQEVTARSKHRGQRRKYLHHITTETEEGSLPPAGTAITAGQDEQKLALGDMRSHAGTVGLAMVRADRLHQAREASSPLLAGATPVQIRALPWLASSLT